MNQELKNLLADITRADVGMGVRQARTTAKLTQEQLAQRVALWGEQAKMLISRIENGQKPCELTVLGRIAAACNVPLADIVDFILYAVERRHSVERLSEGDGAVGESA